MTQSQEPAGRPDQAPSAPYREGEVFAVFRWAGPEDMADSFRFEQADLRDQFDTIGIKVDDRPLRKKPVFLRMNDGTAYVIQAVPITERGHDGVLKAVNEWHARRESLRDQPLVVNNLLLDSIGPTWLIGASQSWSDGGGPGGRPQPGKSGYFRPGKTSVNDGDSMHVNKEYFRVTGREPAADLDGSEIRVMILDTWPMGPNQTNGGAIDHVGRIATFVATSGVTQADHPLLYAAGKGQLVDDFVDNDPDPAIPYRLVNGDHRVFEAPYDKSDHGLFVAGIIRDIAPRASIRVYRVLNDYGGGDLFDIFDALGAITREIHAARGRNERRHYVVNLSFGFLAPLRMIPILIRDGTLTEEEQIGALEGTSNPGSADADLQALEQEQLIATDINAAGIVRIVEWRPDLGPLAQGLAQTVNLFQLLAQFPEILLVAAAGNDSERARNLIFPPRIPAALEGILGVSATKDSGVTSTFSNRDDLEVDRDDGIAAFGGERQSGDTVYETERGVMGAAVCEQLPPPVSGEVSSPNQTGWAQWAGTSFAAPIVVGFAACVWGAHRDWTGSDVLNRLVSPNTGPRNEILLRQH